MSKATTIRALRAAMFCLAAFFCAPAAALDNIAMLEIDVNDYCINWSTFPQGTWTNNTGVTVQIVDVELRLAGAQSLQGEFGLWLATQNYQIASMGVTNYAQPNGPVFKLIHFPPDARFRIPPGGVVYLTINCGPAGVGFTPFHWIGVAQFHVAW